MWKPIDTAPRDRAILVVDGYRNVCFCRKDGEYWTTVDTNGYKAYYRNPIHWMPIPSPPNGDE